jgi:hypothetical protein
MAFTEATLVAQLDAASTGRTITLANFNNVGTTITEVYAVGVTAPYAGRSRWVQLLQSRSAAQAAGDLQAALA